MDVHIAGRTVRALAVLDIGGGAEQKAIQLSVGLSLVPTTDLLPNMDGTFCADGNGSCLA
jgi:hypothetical protein